MIQLKTIDELRLMRVKCSVGFQNIRNVGKRNQTGITTLYLDKLGATILLKIMVQPAFLGYGGFSVFIMYFA